MINKTVSKIFEKYSYNFPQKTSVNQITSYLDQAKSDDIVFYRLKKGRGYQEKFEKRLSTSKADIIVLGGATYLKDNKRILTIGSNFDPIVRECIDSLYPLPGDKKFIGVTGTNGKSSVVSFISQMAHKANISVLSIGTQGAFINGKKQLLKLHLTTPSNIDLRRIIFQNKNNFDLCVIEVSSHGLHQGRIKGLTFDLCVWTNFSQDHLDYHKTMEAYFLAKLQIISYLKKRGHLLVPETSKELVSKKFPKCCIVDLEQKDKLPELCHLFFNQVNISLALQALRKIYREIHFDPFPIHPVEGRVNIFEKNKKTVIVDFAHNPDALLNIIREIGKEFSKKVVLLFGAGGNRDKLKRTAMGKIAEKYADFTYLTSDNPRDENPEDIISEIEKGFSSDDKYKIIVNRKDAINTAIKLLQEDEVLIVAGRGCEENMEIRGTFYPFSDIDIVQSALS